MARANFVKKARKDYPNAGIKKGEPYYWWQRRFGPKQFSKTPPKRSQLTGSEFLQQLYSLEEQYMENRVTAVDFDALENIAQEIRDELENLMNEQEERLSNMPEHLQDNSPAGETLNDRIVALEDAIRQIESIEIFQEPESDEWENEIDRWKDRDEDERESAKAQWKQDKVDEFYDELEQNWPCL